MKTIIILFLLFFSGSIHSQDTLAVDSNSDGTVCFLPDTPVPIFHHGFTSLKEVFSTVLDSGYCFDKKKIFMVLHIDSTGVLLEGMQIIFDSTGVERLHTDCSEMMVRTLKQNVTWTVSRVSGKALSVWITVPFLNTKLK